MPADDEVVPAAAADEVVAQVAHQIIVRGTAQDHVVALGPVDDVKPGTRAQEIATLVASDDVVVRAGNKVLDAMEVVEAQTERPAGAGAQQTGLDILRGAEHRRVTAEVCGLRSGSRRPSG